MVIFKKQKTQKELLTLPLYLSDDKLTGKSEKWGLWEQVQGISLG